MLTKLLYRSHNSNHGRASVAGHSALLVMLFASITFADEPTSLPDIDRDGFTPIFDGMSLDGWHGDPKYWTVADRTLVGTITPETLLNKNSWIVWRGGYVEDFELVLDYRISESGNSGVGYRLAVLSDDPFSVRGPQADIEGANRFTGICYEENGRRLLAARGQSTRILNPAQPPRLIAQFAHPGELQSVVRKQDWNRYRLVVQGNSEKHYINDVLMSQVHDADESHRMKKGLVGVQVHVGPPMKVEFRNIYLKHLNQQPSSANENEEFIYQPGSLAEPDHQATFENLVQQTAVLTAAPADVPLDNKTELEFLTSDLAIVRHDLVDVDLFGDPQTKPNTEKRFDLLIKAEGKVIRVPGAAEQLKAGWEQREHRLKLTWNPDHKCYELVECMPVADAK